MPKGQRIEALYYEASLVADGMEPGRAKAEAAFKAIDKAADAAAAAVDAADQKVAASARKTATAIDGLRESQRRWLDEARKTPGTGGTLAGRESIDRHWDRIAPDPAAIRKAAAGAERMAREMVSSITRTFELKQAEIRESVARGLLSPADARKQGEAAATAYNQGLLRIIEKAGDQGKLQGSPGQSMLISLTSRLKDVDAAGATASRGLGRLREPLTSLATQALGARSSVGTLVSQMSLLGFGASATLVIMAGVAAIASAYNAITESARKARKEIEGVIDRLYRQAEAQKTVGLAGARRDFSVADEERKRAQAALDRLTRSGPTFTSPDGEAPSLTASINAALHQKRLTTARGDLEKATVSATQAEKNFFKASLEGQAATAQTVGSLLQAGIATPRDRSRAAALLHDLRLELAGLGSEMPERRRDIQALIEVLTAADRTAEKAGVRDAKAAQTLADRQRAARQVFATAIAGETPERGDSFEEKINALRAQAEKAQLSAAEIDAAVNRLRAAHVTVIAESSQALARDMQSQLASLTSTKVDDAVQRLKDFDDEIAKKRTSSANGGPELSGSFDAMAAAVRRALDEAVGLTAEAERLEVVLKRIDRSADDGRGFIGAMKEAQKELAVAQAIVDDPKSTPAAREAAEGRVAQIKARINALQIALNAYLERQNALHEEAESRTARIAGNLTQILNVAFGLASAFSGANGELAKMLGASAQVAGGISDIFRLANTKDAKTGKAPGLGGLLSTTSGLISALPGLGQAIGGAMALGATLFGKSPEEQARMQRVRENTQAIQNLTRRVGDLARINVTGSQLTSVSGILENPGLAGARGTDDLSRRLGALLSAQGMTFADLAEFAKQFGVTIDSKRIQFEDLEKLRQAIQASELTQFADTFAGQMQRLDAQFRLFPDLSRPIDQFEEFRKALTRIKDGGGVLSDVLRDFDLSTAEGLEAASRRLQELFEQMQSGGLSAGQLGGLTPQELLDAILRAQGFIDAQRKGGSVPGTGGYSISREITEVTGSRLAAMMSTANVFAGQTAANTAAIATLLRGGPAPLIVPPALPSLGVMQGAQGGSSVVVGPITVNVTGNVTPEVAQRTATLVTDAMVAEIDRKLGQRHKRWKREHGFLGS